MKNVFSYIILFFFVLNINAQTLSPWRFEYINGYSPFVQDFLDTENIYSHGDTVIYTGNSEVFGLAASSFTALNKNLSLKNFPFYSNDNPVYWIISDGEGGYYADIYVIEPKSYVNKSVLHFDAQGNIDLDFTEGNGKMSSGEKVPMVLDNDTVYVVKPFGKVLQRGNKHTFQEDTSWNATTATNSSIDQMLVDEKYVYLRGDIRFYQDGEYWRGLNFARVDKKTARWVEDGLTFSDLESGSLADADSVLLLSGHFGKPANSLIAYNNLESTFPHILFDHLFNDGDVVYDVQKTESGSYYVCGDFKVNYNTANNEVIELRNLIRLNEDFSLDTTFSPFADYKGTLKPLKSVSWNDSNLYVISKKGDFNANIHVIQRTNDSLLVDDEISTNGNIYGLVHITNDSLFVYGNFTRFNNWRASRCMLWVNGDKVDIDHIDSELQSVVQDPENPHYLYMAGFTYYNSEFTDLVRYDMQSQSIDTNFNVEVIQSTEHLAEKFYTLKLIRDTLYFGGKFSSINGTTVPGIAMLSKNGELIDPTFFPETSKAFRFVNHQNSVIVQNQYKAQAYIPSSGKNIWNAFFPEDQLYNVTTDGENLFAMGSFERQFWRNESQGVFKIRKGEKMVLDTHFNCSINKDSIKGIHPNPGENTFVYGNFDSVNGSPKYGLAQIDLADGKMLSWKLDSSINPKINVHDIHVHRDTLYVLAQDSAYAVDYSSGACFWRMEIYSEKAYAPALNDMPYCIFVDDAGIYIGSNGQTKMVNTKKVNSGIVYLNQKTHKVSLPKIEISPNRRAVVKKSVKQGDILYMIWYLFDNNINNSNGDTTYLASLNLRTGLFERTKVRDISTAVDFNNIQSMLFVNDSIYVYDNKSIFAIHPQNFGVRQVLTLDGECQSYCRIKMVSVPDGVIILSYSGEDYSFDNLGGASKPYYRAAKIKNGRLDPDWRLPIDIGQYNTSISDIIQSSDFTYVSGKYYQKGDLKQQYVGRFNNQTNEWDKSFGPGVLNRSSSSGSDYSGISDMEIDGGRLFLTGMQHEELPHELNLLYGFPDEWTPNLQGSGRNIIVAGQHLYLNDAQLAYPFNHHLITYELDSNIHNYRLETIEPNKGNNFSTVSVVLKGLGFKPGSTVSLRQDTTILNFGVASSFTENAFIQTQFDFTKGVPLGMYDVIVTRPDGKQLILKDGFEVTEYESPIYYTDIVGQNAIGIGFWQDFTIVAKNESHQDILGVPINLAISSEADIDFSGSYFMVDENDTIRIKDKSLQYILVDSLGGDEFDGHVYSVVLPLLPAKKEVKWNYKVRHEIPDIDNRVIAWMDRATYVKRDSIASSVIPCYSAIISSLPVNSIGNSSCVLDEILNVYKGTEIALSSDNFTYYMGAWGTAINQGYQGSFIDLNSSIDSISVSCSLDPQEVSMIWKRGWNMTDQSDVLKQVCATPFYPQPVDFKNIPVVASLDPNDKTGPLGLFSAGILTNAEKVHYRIRFENDSSASAPARIVTIIDTLDPLVFDTNSVIFGDVKFGDFSFHPGPEASEVDAVVDLRRKYGVFGAIEASVKAGIVTWKITAIDTITRKLTQNPFAGILPPNHVSPEGQGSVFFEVKLTQPVPDNLIIQNNASIIFDNNEEITTNTFENLIDRIDPVSTVGLLPEQSNDSIFYLPIEGFDNESGILHYQVYVSKNNGAFTLLGTSQTDSLLFIGNNNTRYSFYSVATDSAGNIENKLAIAEQTILIGQNNSVVFNEDDITPKVYPNPSNSIVYVETKEDFPIHSYEIYDIRGIQVGKNGLNISTKQTINFNTFSKGVYFLKLISSNNRSIVVKLQKE